MLERLAELSSRQGIGRRAFLQVGYSSLLGLGLPRLLAAREATAAGATVGRARSVIVILLSGGLGQHDSFDMKPDAPDGIRGEFKPIDTSVPGIRMCEHLPRLAARAQKLAIVRSMSHPEGNHLLAVHRVLTGQVSNPRGCKRSGSGGLARRLSVLCGGPRPDQAAEGWDPERGRAAAAAGRRPADLARPGRRISGAAARSMAASARSGPTRGTRRQPGVASRT